ATERSTPILPGEKAFFPRDRLSHVLPVIRPRRVMEEPEALIASDVRKMLLVPPDARKIRGRYKDDLQGFFATVEEAIALSYQRFEALAKRPIQSFAVAEKGAFLAMLRRDSPLPDVALPATWPRHAGNHLRDGTDHPFQTPFGACRIDPLIFR